MIFLTIFPQRASESRSAHSSKTSLSIKNGQGGLKRRANRRRTSDLFWRSRLLGVRRRIFAACRRGTGSRIPICNMRWRPAKWRTPSTKYLNRVQYRERYPGPASHRALKIERPVLKQLEECAKSQKSGWNCISACTILKDFLLDYIKSSFLGYAEPIISPKGYKKAVKSLISRL